jgi:hypothetical protein
MAAYPEDAPPLQDIGSKIIWFRNASGESQQLGFAAIYRRSFDEVFGTPLACSDYSPR